VIEDCALAAGSSVAGQSAGTFGDAAVFSMELSKTLSCGWGGILLVRDRKLADEVERLLRCLPEPARCLRREISGRRQFRPGAISLPCTSGSESTCCYLGFKCGLFPPIDSEPEVRRPCRRAAS
jgi:hypothetical protein